MSDTRYVIQHFDLADGGRSWHVYDSVERCHIHTATHGFINQDKSEPACCTKICTALNYIEAQSHNKPIIPCSMCGKALQLSDTICHDCREYAS